MAVLRFGPHVSYDLIDDGFLSAILAGGMVSEEEHTILLAGEDLDGEKIRLIWSDAGFNFANTVFIVEQAIDAGADVIVTYSTPVTQAAALVTSEMDEPTPLIFTSVYDPFAAGIARSNCVKPDHVTGVELITPYEDIVPLLLLQDPDIQVIGTLYSSSEASGAEGARRIIEVSSTHGLQVEEAAVAGIAELQLAAEGLVERGVEALVIPADMTTVSALPIIMQVAAENQLPVFPFRGFRLQRRGDRQRRAREVRVAGRHGGWHFGGASRWQPGHRQHRHWRHPRFDRGRQSGLSRAAGH